MGPDGEVAYIIHRIEDVTPFMQQMREEKREAEGHELLETRARHMEAEVVLRGQELQKANEALHSLNAQLKEQAVERERLLVVAQRAREEAERQRLEAQTASEAKSQFLATMSHELRTPLNAIAGHVQLLDLELHGPLSNAQHESLSRVERAQRNLMSLINDVLNFTQIGAGKVEYDLKPVDLSAFITDITAIMDVQASVKNIQYEAVPPTGDCLVWADVDKLRQVVLNLLVNAVKFTPERGRVTLDVVDVKSEGLVKLRVQDSGIGIPPEKHEAIFQPFVQINRSLTRPMEGIGLGLTISRDLSRGMGGDLTLQSNGGAGSTFLVTLRRVNS
jgi:signal transduction histidine kinase